MPPTSSMPRRALLAAALAIVPVATLTSPATTAQAVAPAPVSPWAPGTRISYRTSQQVMVAQYVAHNRGTYNRYEWRGTSTGWVRVGSSRAAFGYGGVKPGSRRVEGDGSTPLGTYPIMETFGVGNPGTRMTYHRIDRCSWWSAKGRTYNRFVEQCGHGSGEHLIDYTTNTKKQYLQAAVIGFNWNQVRSPHRGSGSGIFLHYAPGNTAGCVGVMTRSEIDATVAWLDPARHPMIVIRRA